MINANGPASRWLDSTATIVNGRVLLTPPEADAVYCLNLADGKPVWKEQPRGEHNYVACVHKGVVVLVGRNAIDAIKLEDGSKAWGPITMTSGAEVCGRGFYTGSQYFLPLSSGDVTWIDLESGKIAGSVKSRRSAPPGNLICYRGRVISQGLDGLELYYQADVARDEVARLLAANQDDVEGLTLRGELFLDAGKPAEAVADFRRAYGLDNKSDSHGRTRELFRDALLVGLHDDFKAHRAMASEVEQLLDDVAQRASFFRYMATGLQRAGEWKSAIEYYLKLADLEEPKPALEKIEESYLARRDCWIQAQLGLLRSEWASTPEGSAADARDLNEFIERALKPRLDAALKDTSVNGLKRFLGFFGNQPQAAPARTELLKRLTNEGRIVEAELLLAAAMPASTGDPGADRKAQAALLADMAELNLHAGRSVRDAAACFRQLMQEYADVPCRAGSNGEQLTPARWLAILPDGDALRREIADHGYMVPAAPVWPVGEVEAKPETTSRVNNRMPRFDLRLGGGAPGSRGGGPFFADYSVNMEISQQEVSLCNGLGSLQNPIRLVNNENGRNYNVMYNQNTTLARTCGHILLISAGMRIWALDPWNAAGTPPAGGPAPAPPSGKGPQILWSQDLSDPTADNNGNMVFINNGGDQDMRANPFGPVNSRYVSFLRRRNLVVVDPFTGEPLWTRQDIPPGSEVFGDEQYVLVLPPTGDQASVYRGTDGQLLGTRKVPRPSMNGNPAYYAQMAGNSALSGAGIEYFGRHVLTWQQSSDGAPGGNPLVGAGQSRVLGLFDPWQQKAVWPSRTFAAGAFASVVGSEAVGVLEPSGHFVLVALFRRPHDCRFATRDPAAVRSDGPSRDAVGRSVHRGGQR